MPHKSKSRKHAGMKKRRTHRMRGGMMLNLSTKGCMTAELNALVCRINKMLNDPRDAFVLSVANAMGQQAGYIVEELQPMLTNFQQGSTVEIEEIMDGGAKRKLSTNSTSFQTLLTHLKTRFPNLTPKEESAVLQFASQANIENTAGNTQRTNLERLKVVAGTLVQQLRNEVASSKNNARLAELELASQTASEMQVGARSYSRWFIGSMQKYSIAAGVLLSAACAALIAQIPMQDESEDSLAYTQQLGLITITSIVGLVGTTMFMIRESRLDVARAHEYGGAIAMAIAAGGDKDTIKQLVSNLNSQELARINQLANTINAFGRAMNTAARPVAEIMKHAITEGAKLGKDVSTVIQEISKTAFVEGGKAAEKVAASTATAITGVASSGATAIKDVAASSATAITGVASSGATVLTTGLTQAGTLGTTTIKFLEEVTKKSLDVGKEIVTNKDLIDAAKAAASGISSGVSTAYTNVRGAIVWSANIQREKDELDLMKQRGEVSEAEHTRRLRMLEAQQAALNKQAEKQAKLNALRGKKPNKPNNGSSRKNGNSGGTGSTSGV